MDEDQARVYAASRARKTMPFSQGSKGVKLADNFKPYLGASIAALRVAASYVADNPKRFAKKWAEAGAGLTVLSFLMYMFMPEDEMDNIPNWELERHFVIPLFWENEEGNMAYMRIRINPQIAVFVNPYRILGRNLAKHAKGKSVDWKQDFSDLSLSIQSAIPVLGPAVAEAYRGIFGEGSASRAIRSVLSELSFPTMAAYMAYVGNYDSFRDRDVAFEKGTIPEDREGLYDNRVHETYKALGKVSGMSPKRLQAAGSKVLTEPHTNLFVATAFAVSDEVLGAALLEQDERSRGAGELLERTGKRLIRYTNPEWKNYRRADKGKEFELEENAIRYRVREVIKTMVRRNASVEEIVEYVNGLNLGKEDRDYAGKYADATIAIRDIQHPQKFELIQMAYIRDPEAQAQYFYANFGVVDSPEDVIEMKKVLSAATGKKWNFSDRFKAEYDDLVNQAAQ